MGLTFIGKDLVTKHSPAKMMLIVTNETTYDSSVYDHP